MGFFDKPIGRKFAAKTVPELVRELSRLNDNIEKYLEEGD